ncbi:PTS transporter subunit EIIC [Mammaliicoccus vitulinus]|uniref:PTS transporter subunit EIIC n=1 Tax=Mammaliicoccus vitulinus TaxID=71237 RepID=UPI000D1D3D9E|nr:PTS transporter subunit EIIC [Mammaliicoccus vitulinus]PTI90280.1 PTS acetylglucosamine transporter subunit IIB [Mammaliicoccus vitulinus]
MMRFLQKLGRSMLIPIVALPAAGILFRISSEDLLDWKLFQASGAIFNNIDILIAIGIAMGLSKTKDRGIPALTGFIAISILKEGLNILDSDLNMSVFGGLISGLLAAWVYNKFKDVELPKVFSFFSGENFPITMIILLMLPVTGISFLVWPYAQSSIDWLAQILVTLGGLGVFINGFLNRFLLPFGLHHVLNTYIYFGLGDFKTSGGEVVHGEVTRFLNGDPTAGYFLSGYFVSIMFGVPAIALAISKAAKYNKQNTKALMGSGSFTAIVAGITEPIEFTFLFTSPFLYFIHSVYTGLAGMTLYYLHIREGFSWGGSIIDYVLNLGLSDKGWMIIPVGIGFFILYFVTFYFYIINRNVPIIGQIEESNFDEEKSDEEKDLSLTHNQYRYMSKKILENIGTKDNVIEYENCITRLRLELRDTSLINKDKIMQTGAHGVVIIDKHNAQIIIGPEVTKLVKEFNKEIENT